MDKIGSNVVPLRRDKDLNLTGELADLLDLTSRVAVAIRLNSSYSTREFGQTHADNVRWLAESLHKFESLAGAIRSKDQKSIGYSCDMLIEDYRVSYPTNYGGSFTGKRGPKEVFGQTRDSSILSDGIRILESIKTKLDA